MARRAHRAKDEMGRREEEGWWVVGEEVGGGDADRGLMEEGEGREGRYARVGAPLKVARYGMEGKVRSRISPLLL